MRALFEGGYYSSSEGKSCGYNSRAGTIEGRVLFTKDYERSKKDAFLANKTGQNVSFCPKLRVQFKGGYYYDF